MLCLVLNASFASLSAVFGDVWLLSLWTWVRYSPRHSLCVIPFPAPIAPTKFQRKHFQRKNFQRVSKNLKNISRYERHRLEAPKREGVCCRASLMQSLRCSVTDPVTCFMRTSNWRVKLSYSWLCSLHPASSSGAFRCMRCINMDTCFVPGSLVSVVMPCTLIPPLSSSFSGLSAKGLPDLRGGLMFHFVTHPLERACVCLPPPMFAFLRDCSLIACCTQMTIVKFLRKD